MLRLSRFVPGFLLRVFAQPYVAGASVEAALDVVARGMAVQGERASLDLLGEAAVEEPQVLRTVATYEGLIDAIAADPRFADRATRPSVSVKPSAFAVGGPAAGFARIAALVARARDRQVPVTIDMEDRAWTEATLAAALEMHKLGHDVGAVLQSRLHRTAADVERIPAGMRVRVVIGIYPEPPAVAIEDKPTMKVKMLEFAARLLDRGAFVEFATHDEPTLERFLREVAPRAPERCEIQMLLGVPRERFLARLRAGGFGTVVPFRRYVPFATSWDDATAYLRRRMDESPSIVFSVLKNLGSWLRNAMRV